MGNGLIPAICVTPGEFYLATATVQCDMRFEADGDVYEIVGGPIRIGAGWMARVRLVGGTGPAGEYNAMLRTGRPTRG